MVGRTISHYKVLEKIGEGGMGVVYKAQDTKLDRPVALKFLAAHLLQDEVGRRRFLREGRAAAALDHPNICTVYEIDEADGQAFLAMAYVEGESLTQKILGRPLPLEEALEIAIQVAEGLHAAHRREIVHRDIKSANIMIDDEGRAKIMDFGLARPAGARLLTKTGSAVGTPAYMSPEQAQAESVDHRTDIWSLGVLIYEMLAGQLPFEGEAETAVLLSIVSRDPDPITSRRAGIPAVLDRIVTEKCLAKDPADRYQHVEELLVDLRRIRQEPASEWTSVSPSRRRARSRLRYIAAAVLLAIVAVWTAVLMVAPGSRQTSDGARQAALAVLPFENLSGDSEQEYFSLGITEEVITQLAGVGALKVIARPSVMRFQNSELTLGEIARELNVDHLLVGSVVRLGDRVRVSVQLVEASTEQSLWANSFERDVVDVLSVQSEVARAVAREIDVELQPGEEDRLTSVRQVNPEAYEAVLKGRFFFYQMNPTAIERSLEYFRQAVAADPTYAPAYAWLAAPYRFAVAMGMASGKENLPLAKAAAVKALELDPNLAVARTAMAMYHCYAREWAACEAGFRQALELSPSDADTHHRYGVLYLTPMGRLNEALEELQKARDLDPLSAAHTAFASLTLHRMGEDDRAIEMARKALELDPDHSQSLSFLARAYLAKGMSEEAIAAYRKSGRSGQVLGMLGLAYAQAGRVNEAREVLRELTEQGRQQYVSPLGIALVHMGLGDHDRAFEWLEAAYESSETLLSYLKVDPIFEPLRPDPRFQDLVQKLGLDL